MFMVTINTLEAWLRVSSETECLEFKEAKQQFDNNKLLDYCVALGNEGGGHLVLGVTNQLPRRVIGTQAFRSESHLNEIKLLATNRLGIRLEIVEISHPDGRVLIFSIPGRPLGQPLHIDGRYLMRAGESLVGMTSDHLRRIMDETKTKWLEDSAVSEISADEVVALLDTQAFFDLLELPYPSDRNGVIERLLDMRLISRGISGWNITNMTALLLAKRLEAFSDELARKAPRVIVYEGTSKLITRVEAQGVRGYAVGFEALLDHVHSLAPQNIFVEQVLRQETKMFPKQALRELIANALVHQDFEITGRGVKIEMYDDRVEISNAGIPPIEPDRFIDEDRARNERLAGLMRKFRICEQKGSGMDKVIELTEVFQLPAHEVLVGGLATTIVLYSHRDFYEMGKADRVRACYQHCVLQYITRKRMSNQSLRERFGLPETATATVSQVIGATKDEGRIKLDDSESTSTRYAKYVPYWA